MKIITPLQRLVVFRLGESLMEEIYVGPNPATEVITISTPSDFQLTKITLADSQGKLIINKPVTDQENFSLPVSGLSKGMHIIGLYTSEKAVFKKIIIH